MLAKVTVGSAPTYCMFSTPAFAMSLLIVRMPVTFPGCEMPMTPPAFTVTGPVPKGVWLLPFSEMSAP